MAKRWNRTETWLTLAVLAAASLLTAIAGLFGYMSLTAIPLHSNPETVPAVTRATPPPRWSDAVEKGRRLARAGVVEQNLPGLSIAVGVGNEVVWAEGFGYADLETRVPIKPDMRFRIANVSNALTSAAVGLLLEKNRVHLDDEIQTYVPEYPRKQWPVTIRQLMGQLAGVVNDAGDEEPLMVRCDRTVDVLQRFAGRDLLFEPGTRFRPSSYGWILVSAAVEAAADEPFFSYMRTKIFEPLGMASTRPDSARESIPDRATFYFPRFAGNTRYGPDPAREGDHSCLAGGGAFLSTPSDLVRFGSAINSGRLLQPSTVRLLQTPQRLASGQESGYGLGWRLEAVALAGEPARMAGHETKPDFIGGTTSLMTFPERGLVVAVTTNISFADTRSLALKIAEAFAEHTNAAQSQR